MNEPAIKIQTLEADTSSISHLHWHECEEVCDERMETSDVKFFLAETLTSEHALLNEQEDISQKSLVGQSLICLSELHQSCTAQHKNTLH